jgi:hypothetical protein
MKYLEELGLGDCFSLANNYYVVTSDFKKDGKKLCINLKTGFSNWIKPDETVENIDIFTLDKDSNIIAIKERIKDTSNDLPQNN